MKKILNFRIVAICSVVMLTIVSCKDQNTPEGGKVQAVDLGLPSGVKWANMNVGATKPEEYGDYFAWGETSPQIVNTITRITYKWSKDVTGKLTKYCLDSKDGYNRFTDGKSSLDPEDDIAHVNWGGKWCMPTKAEQEELRTECNWDWTNDYNGTGIKGYIVSSKKNKKSIFLPAAGYMCDNVYNPPYSTLVGVGSYGNYWSVSLYETHVIDAYSLSFSSDVVEMYDYARWYGLSVRPVCK